MATGFIFVFLLKKNYLIDEIEKRNSSKCEKEQKLKMAQPHASLKSLGGMQAEEAVPTRDNKAFRSIKCFEGFKRCKLYGFEATSSAATRERLSYKRLKRSPKHIQHSQYTCKPFQNSVRNCKL